MCRRKVLTHLDTPRSGSSNRANDRLQERLARAVAAKSGAPSPSLGSSAASASAATSPRQSLDVPSRASIDGAASGSKDASSTGETAAAQKSTDGSQRPSFESSTDTKDDTNVYATVTNGDKTTTADAAKPATETSTATAKEATTASETGAKTISTPEPAITVATDYTMTARDDDAATVTTSVSQPAAANAAALDEVRESRIKQLEAELLEQRRQHQDEIHHHTEKTEALQAKVQYLASEAAEAAKKSLDAAAPGSLEKKVAEKDQKIAQIMLEGKNLSVMEEKHRSILKKLRVKISDDEKEIAEFKTARTKAEGELQTLRVRARRATELERSQEEAHKRLSQVQKELEGLRSDAVSKDATIADLRQQVKAANEHAEAIKVKINDAALEKERQRVKELEEQVATAQLEKSLAADRAKAQIKEWQEKADKAAERTRTVELDMQNEVQIMESKLEAMRGRAEEVSSGAIGDSHAKLMRQVETLQSQYSIASDNWQGIETTLLARVANLEKERDEALQRESDMRKKAREAVSIDALEDPKKRTSF
jgi:TATA element modulatory factor